MEINYLYIIFLVQLKIVVIALKERTIIMNTAFIDFCLYIVFVMDTIKITFIYQHIFMLFGFISGIHYYIVNK